VIGAMATVGSSQKRRYGNRNPPRGKDIVKNLTYPTWMLSSLACRAPRRSRLGDAMHWRAPMRVCDTAPV
jgi:hypothetical protein